MFVAAWRQASGLAGVDLVPDRPPFVEPHGPDSHGPDPPRLDAPSLDLPSLDSGAFELSLGDLTAETEPRLRWEMAFGVQRPLRIEIGVGNSDFLPEVAAREPEFNYLGFEYSAKRVAKFLKRVASRGLTNIRMLRTEVRRAIESIVEPGSVDHIFILFPDPWPKRRHAKHRFIQLANIPILARLLRAGGGLSLRTDSQAYAAQMLSVLDAAVPFENLAGAGRFSPEALYPFPTRYELKYRREGRPIHYLEYRRRV